MSATEGLLLTVELTPEQLDVVAQRVAALLQPAVPTVVPLVDARTVAQALGVSRDTVYARAEELGGQRVGDGERPRWRFDLEKALDAWTHRSSSEESEGVLSPASTGATRRRRQQRKGSGRQLLPIHDDRAPDRGSV